MAERPCDCGVLCLRPKSSLCSCLRLLYVRPALQRTWFVTLRCEVSVFRTEWVTFGEYFTGKVAPPTNQCWCQKTRVIAFSCGIKISTVHHLVLSRYTHLTDGQNCNSNTVHCITCSRTLKIIKTGWLLDHLLVWRPKVGGSVTARRVNICQVVQHSIFITW